MNYGEMTSLLKQRGIEISNETCVKFDQYLHLLVEWNEKFNLTSIVIPEEIIEKHFYDCLIASDPTLFQHQQVLDIGSGAGFPGIVWAIAYPDSSFTLLDATKKKCLFLEEVKKALDLSNVTAIHGKSPAAVNRNGAAGIVVIADFNQYFTGSNVDHSYCNSCNVS